jgi:hypothetical protein
MSTQPVMDVPESWLLMALESLVVLVAYELVFNYSHQKMLRKDLKHV